MSDIKLLVEARERMRDAYLGTRVIRILEKMADRIETLNIENSKLLADKERADELEGILADVSQDDGFKLGYKQATDNAVSAVRKLMEEEYGSGDRQYALIEAIGAIKGACNK